MRLWGACLLVAGILMLLPLQTVVTSSLAYSKVMHSTPAGNLVSLKYLLEQNGNDGWNWIYFIMGCVTGLILAIIVGFPLGYLYHQWQENHQDNETSLCLQ